MVVFCLYLVSLFESFHFGFQFWNLFVKTLLSKKFALAIFFPKVRFCILKIKKCRYFFFFGFLFTGSIHNNIWPRVIGFIIFNKYPYIQGLHSAYTKIPKLGKDFSHIKMFNMKRRRRKTNLKLMIWCVYAISIMHIMI